MLFIQGSRDALADMSLLTPLIGRLEPRATLKAIEHADHSFHCHARTGRTDKQVLEEALDAMTEWYQYVLNRPGR
jgi:hypothetical protein